eukprot:1068472-Amphidinium_carterae.1
MKVNLKKTVVICNGTKAKRLLMKVWKAGRLPPPRITTRDLGVDRCPVQHKRVYFTWYEADYKVKLDSARVLVAEVAAKRPDFAGLETGLRVWHEDRTNKALAVGDLCVRCKEEVEDLSHIMFRCPRWHKKRRQVELPADDVETPASELASNSTALLAPWVPAVISHFKPDEEPKGQNRDLEKSPQRPVSKKLWIVAW